MNYEDALEASITKAQAKREIELHSANWNEFVADVGEKEMYIGEEVLGWLGY